MWIDAALDTLVGGFGCSEPASVSVCSPACNTAGSCRMCANVCVHLYSYQQCLEVPFLHSLAGTCVQSFPSWPFCGARGHLTVMPKGPGLHRGAARASSLAHIPEVRVASGLCPSRPEGWLVTETWLRCAHVGTRGPCRAGWTAGGLSPYTTLSGSGILRAEGSELKYGLPSQ